MTNEDWQKLKEWWGHSLYSSFRLQCDEYNILLKHEVYKMKVNIIVYVDGWVKGEWFTKGNLIGLKFYPTKKQAVYSVKELKSLVEIWGKRSPEAQQRYYEWVDCKWTSFAAFKKHILSTCKDINVIEE